MTWAIGDRIFKRPNPVGSAAIRFTVFSNRPAATASLPLGAYSSEYLNPVGTEVGGTLANFSTYGPTLDERLKPNVSAPGVNVEAP
jgi:hypothetical protein